VLTREAGGKVKRCSAIEKTDLVKALGGETEAERHLHCDRIGQIRDVPVIEAAEQPALRLRHLEDRAARGDPQIGALDQHEPAAHRIPIDRGNDRFLQGPGHERIIDCGPPPAEHAVLERFLHVFAGAERPASPGKDRNLQFIVAAELRPSLGEPRAHFMTERVEALGAVHPDDQDLPVTLGFDDGHLCLSPCSMCGAYHPLPRGQTAGQLRACCA
jgi:hypothetical protein